SAISNLGMYGIREFSAIINPPHATILAVGAGERRPVESEDRVRFVTRMTVTLSCDHRVVDGALGAELLGAFKHFIEHPVGLMIGVSPLRSVPTVTTAWARRYAPLPALPARTDNDSYSAVT